MEDAPQVALAKDDDVVQALTSRRIRFSRPTAHFAAAACPVDAGRPTPTADEAGLAALTGD
jgi:hypothetical protein